MEILDNSKLATNIEYQRLPLIGKLKVKIQYAIVLFLFSLFTVLSFASLSIHIRHQNEQYAIYDYYFDIVNFQPTNVSDLRNLKNIGDPVVYKGLQDSLEKLLQTHGLKARQEVISQINKQLNTYKNSITWEYKYLYIVLSLSCLFLSFTCFGLLFLIYMFEKNKLQAFENEKHLNNEIAVMNLLYDLLPYENNDFTKNVSVSDNLVGGLADKLNVIFNKQIDIIKNIREICNNSALNLNLSSSKLVDVSNQVKQQESYLQNMNKYFGRLSLIINRNQEILDQINQNRENHGDKVLFILSENAYDIKNILVNIDSELNEFTLVNKQVNEQMMHLINENNSLSKQVDLLKEYISTVKYKS